MTLLAFAMLGALSTRPEAIALLQARQPAAAEVLLLQGEPQPDLLVQARIAQGGVPEAWLPLLQVLDAPASIWAGTFETIFDRQQQMVWQVEPVLTAGPRRDRLVQALLVAQPRTRSGQGVRGSMLSMLTGTLHVDARHAPVFWRDVAMALAGDKPQRRAARGRLSRVAAPPHEQAWRLWVIGRSALLENAPGAQRTGLVHLARLIADEDLANAHPRLALDAARTLHEHRPDSTLAAHIARLEATLRSEQ